MSKSIIQQKRILTKAGGGSSIPVPVSPANGGTGISSYSIGDLIYASGATTLSKLADVATGSVLVSGGVGVAPSWTSSLTLGTLLSAPSGAFTSANSLVVGQASTATGKILFRNAGAAGSTSIISGAVAGNIIFTLPTTVGSASQFLQTDGAGVLSWAAITSGAAISALTLATASNTIDNTNYAQEWQWSTLAGGNGLKLSSTSTVAASNTQTLLNIALSGANGTAAQTTYGLQVSNTHTGTTSTNIAGYFAASGGATANLAIQTSGKIQIGNASAYSTTNILEVEGGINAIYNGGQYRYRISYNSGGDIITTLASNVTEAQYFNGGAYPLTFGTGNAETFRIIGYNINIGNGITNTSAASGTLSVTSGSGTNNAGASLTKASGKATGTAAGGNNVEQTSVKGSSGTTLQPLTDRHNIVGKYVDITGGAATTFGNLALTTSGTIAGGVIIYTVEANDGTDFQSLSGSAPYSVVNKAGTLTYVLGIDTQSSACSTGTLTGTLSLAAASTTLAFQMNAVSSLVETVLRISFQVLNNMGVATISAA